MKKTLIAIVLAGFCATVHADISMPKRENFYDRLGRGIANVVGAPTEIADSVYYYNQVDGGTVAFSKGLVQGISRMVCDFAQGGYEIVTSPLPVGPDGSYRTFKQPPWNCSVVDEYPPADLKYFW